MPISVLTVFGTLCLLAFSSAAWAGQVGLFPDAFHGATTQLSLQKTKITLQEDASVRAFLNNNKENRLSPTAGVESAQIKTTKFQHFYKGLEVVGSAARVHSGPAGDEVTQELVSFDLDIRPSFSAAEAVQIAESETGTGDSQNLILAATPTLKILPTPESKTAQLVYWVTFEGSGLQPGRDVILDAHSGKVLANLSEHLEIAPVHVFSASGQGVAVNLQTLKKSDVTQEMLDSCQIVDSLTGNPLALNPTACRLTISGNRMAKDADRSAISAYQNSNTVLNYFKSTFDRDSFDGLGTPLVSVVHVGIKMNNAFWNPKANYMAYGDGDGVSMGDLTQAVDVAGHEMTHGVTASTAKLISMGESGALNEAYSDFFGIMISRNASWIVGESILKNQDGTVGIRNLADPGRLYQLSFGRRYPGHLNEIMKFSKACSEQNDRCGVHFNSTIPGHASFLVARAIGAEKAQLLYYTTLTHYLNEQSTFRNAADNTVRACLQLFKQDQKTCNAVKGAFAQVGL